LTLHPVTGEVWETEFGPNGGDELNRIEKGKNYGWIQVTNGKQYEQKGVEGLEQGPEAKHEGMVDPVVYWAPSINPGNLVFYTGGLSSWKGNLLMAAMSRSLVRITFDAQGQVVAQERMLTELSQRFRDVRMGPDGNIYLLTDETAGAVLKVEPGK
jgi:glucose/arabinose dehydrogenase